MANTKSAKKDLRRSLKRRAQNQATKSALKTYIKKVRTTATSDLTAADQALAKASSALDKAVKHGTIHKNQAARRKSRAAKALNKAKAASAGA